MPTGDPELAEGGVTIVEPENFSRGEARGRWAELIRLVYEVDPMVCPKCGGEMRVIALIQEPAVIDKILRHLREKGRDARAHAVGDGAARGWSDGRGGVRAASVGGASENRGQATRGRGTGGDGGWVLAAAWRAGAGAANAAEGRKGGQTGSGGCGSPLPGPGGAGERGGGGAGLAQR